MTTHRGCSARSTIPTSKACPPWLAARLTPERAERICDQITVDDGRGFLRQMVDNLAVAL